MRPLALWAQSVQTEVPAQWFTYILGPYGTLVVLLIVFYLLLTTRPWGLIARHQFQDMKDDRDWFRTEYQAMLSIIDRGHNVTGSAVELAKRTVVESPK